MVALLLELALLLLWVLFWSRYGTCRCENPPIAALVQLQEGSRCDDNGDDDDDDNDDDDDDNDDDDDDAIDVAHKHVMNE